MAQTTWAHRATHPLVRRLIGTPVTPNHLTALRLITGFAAMWHFGRGEPGPGGLLFVISAYLDRADGELARLSGQVSRLGHQLDFGSDITITTLLFVGIGAGLREDPIVGSAALAFGVTAGVAVTLTFLLVMRLDSLGAAAFSGSGGFDPDDVLFLVGPIAWLGGLPWLLLAGGIGAPLFLAAALYRWRNTLARDRLQAGTDEGD